MSTTAQQRVEAAGRLSLIANKTFSSEARELLAYISNTDSFWKSMLSWIKTEAPKELIPESDPTVDGYLSILRRAFVTLLDEGTVELVQPLSGLAQTALNLMRRQTNIGAESLPAPVVELTPEQKLESQVIEDFARLSGDQFRARLNGSRAYRDCYRNLAEAGRIAVGAAPQAATPEARELSADQRLVMVDQSRFVSSVADGQIRCTANRGEALVLSQEQAQTLVTRLKRGHFVQAAVVA